MGHELVRSDEGEREGGRIVVGRWHQSALKRLGSCSRLLLLLLLDLGPVTHHARRFTLGDEFRAQAARALEGGAALTHAHTVLRLEDMNGPHNVLPADGALAHPLAAFGAGYHVTTFQ